MATESKSPLDKLIDGHRLVTLRKWLESLFVKKDGKKVLSDNNYTDEDKEKVDNIISDVNIAENAEVDEMLDDVFGNEETDTI